MIPKEQNLYDNSYIFFYSDHGGPFPRHKRAIYETGSKVPMIIKFPKSINIKNKRNRDLLNFIDFAPTILSVAGIDIPEIYQGRAFLGSNKNKNSIVRIKASSAVLTVSISGRRDVINNSPSTKSEAKKSLFCKTQKCKSAKEFD